MPSNTITPAVFQDFAARTSPKTVRPRLRALRAAMIDAGVDGFLVPRADAHRGEAVPQGEARLAYLTSFTGSAGMAVIGPKKAGLFVDSRYALQAPRETDPRLVRVVESAQGATDPRIADFLPKGGMLAFDPWLHTPGEIETLTTKTAGRLTLKPVANLVDAIWRDRPPPPLGPIEFLGPNRAGKPAGEKLGELRKILAAEGADALLLTLPESVNWLFNMRGRDVPHTPVVLCFALIPRRGLPALFVAREKITPELSEGLAGICKVHDKATLPRSLERLKAGGKRLWLDPATAPLALASIARGGPPPVEKPDPVLAMKARKNEAEVAGMREAHRLDGVALAKFLCWFEAHAPGGTLTEIAVVEALEHFRREEPNCVDASFDTIAGAGANGAIVHYRVDNNSNRALVPGELMLVDSGAQYSTGTTDITRTLYSGKPGAEAKERFTRVLKGMIALSMARFPIGTSGAQLDVLARQFLWADGVTYGHGTGHGVGAFLGVHEGPAGFSPRHPTALEPGMILSNEPGFYKAGAYGIRIENLVLVVPSPLGDGRFLELETLTLCPIDRRLIDDAQLGPHERDWLNTYHKRVYKELAPALGKHVKAWLKQATRRI